MSFLLFLKLFYYKEADYFTVTLRQCVPIPLVLCMHSRKQMVIKFFMERYCSLYEGEAGIGKSTLMDTIFKADLAGKK